MNPSAAREISTASIRIDRQGEPAYFTGMKQHAGLKRYGRLAAAGLATLMLSQSALAAQVCAPSIQPAIDINRSLVVTDDALDKDKFAFSATIDAILTSLGINPDAASRENLVSSMIVSFNAQQFNNPGSGLPMRVDPRPLEAALDPKKLLDPLDDMGLVPIALFNRFDLVPADFSNCGEHRIVYSFKDRIGNPAGPPSRFFLIFEARLDNPQPGGSAATAFEGCRPVADFWRSLSDESDAAARALRLAEFYYDGLPGTAGPVVDARNYGGPLGQVRGNIFMNAPGTPPEWQLREWIVINSGGSTPASFLPVTVKSNPLAEFYQDSNSGSADQVLEALERTRFQQDFNQRHLRELIDFELAIPAIPSTDNRYDARLDVASPDFDQAWYDIVLLNTVGARFDNRANEFQSVSQGNEDDPVTLSHLFGGLFLNSAAQTLNGVQVEGDREPTVDDVLTRAGAVGCGGCHQFSEGLSIGSLSRRINGDNVDHTINWPASAGFVHVTEPGQSGEAVLSPALVDAFLPFRADTLCKAVASPIAAPLVALSSAPTATLRAEQNELAQLSRQLTEANAQGSQAERAIATQRVLQRTFQMREDETKKPGFFVTNRRPH